MKVPYTSFKKIISDNKNEYTKKFLKTLNVGNYINGKECSKFESNFAKFCSVKFASGTSNGTCALRMGIEELNLKQGSEIITPPNSFIASTSSIIKANLIPKFVDISEDWNINVDLIEQAITKNTKAIMAVHLTGRPAKMDLICSIAKKYNLFVIEDAAQSFGAKLKNKKVGSYGDFGCFSLHPLKNLFSFGDGGMIVSNKKSFIKNINIRKNHGLSKRDTCDFFSCNCRLDEIHASILNVQLKQINKINSYKRKIAKIYNDNLKDYVVIPSENEDEYHVYQTYIIFSEKRNKLQDYLKKKSIQSLVHYPTPIHLQPAAKFLGYKKGSFPVTEKLSSQVLSLPSFLGMSENQIDYVIKNIKNFFKGK